MLAQNIPLQMKPKEQWEVCENAWEAVVERAIYEKAQEIAKERLSPPVPVRLHP